MTGGAPLPLGRPGGDDLYARHAVQAGPDRASGEPATHADDSSPTTSRRLLRPREPGAFPATG